MSSGPQACRDDEDDWCYLKKNAGISGINWKVYSVEAELAKEFFLKEKLTGIELIMRVKKEAALLALKQNINKEYDEVAKAIAFLKTKGLKVTF